MPRKPLDLTVRRSGWDSMTLATGLPEGLGGRSSPGYMSMADAIDI